VSEELIQLVDRQGRPAGSALRRICHGDPRLLQGVTHLYLFDPQGRLYLQLRSAAKDRFPGCWDTSVGGHLAPGETPEQALRREAREELGITLARWEALASYIYADEVESEYVFAFRTVYSGPLQPDPAEVTRGEFVEPAELRRRLAATPGEFTPHFREGFRRLKLTVS
jgi:isopentenyldiphosphate isomerase